jgi:hypothetical protein
LADLSNFVVQLFRNRRSGLFLHDLRLPKGILGFSLCITRE